jgi:putative tricarboxylic transport membrane protein
MSHRLRARLTKNFLAGLMFIGFGLLGLWLSMPLDNGTLSDMGPGYFPRAISILLVLLGAGLSATDLMHDGEAVEGWAWKPLVLITMSSIAFAVLLRPVGLVGTLAATTILASAAGTLLRPLALAMLVAIMVVANVGIFVFALNMPIPLWPAIF